jgi:predicted DsbA family dithiol-disulfide isomerase
LYDLLNQRHFP